LKNKELGKIRKILFLLRLCGRSPAKATGNNKKRKKIKIIAFFVKLQNFSCVSCFQRQIAWFCSFKNVILSIFRKPESNFFCFFLSFAPSLNVGQTQYMLLPFSREMLFFRASLKKIWIFPFRTDFLA
jgi:hypothetical protein